MTGVEGLGGSGGEAGMFGGRLLPSSFPGPSRVFPEGDPGSGRTRGADRSRVHQVPSPSPHCAGSGELTDASGAAPTLKNPQPVYAQACVRVGKIKDRESERARQWRRRMLVLEGSGVK